MYHALYVSSATDLFSDEELVALLEKSRKNNHAVDVTGMLLYNDGNFMQLLEGPKPAVEKVLVRIQADPRHRGIIQLLQGETEKRNFSEWAMGFKKMDKESVKDLPGYSNFLNLTVDEFKQDPSKALALLVSFKQMIR
jgi:hypothetical protein